MKTKILVCFVVLAWSGLPTLLKAQGAKRLAITVNNKGKFPEQQARISDAITSQLAGHPGLTIIDNDQVEQLLKQQNEENSDRYAPESAVRIGKLVGANLLVVVQVEDFSSTTSVKHSFGSSKTIGSVILQAHVRMTNVQTGVILAQPEASFHDSATLSDASSNPAISMITHNRINPNSSSGDAQAESKALVNRAIGAVSQDLASKIEGATGTTRVESGSANGLAASSAITDSVLVAGIYDGAVYINKGSASGVKVGDRFQIVRVVELPPVDPVTGKHLTSKKSVCTFLAKTVDESNSAGSCDGGVPQQGDSAQPLPR